MIDVVPLQSVPHFSAVLPSSRQDVTIYDPRSSLVRSYRPPPKLAHVKNEKKEQRFSLVCLVSQVQSENTSYLIDIR